MKKIVKTSMVLLLAGSLLSGCFGTKAAEDKPVRLQQSEVTGSLKVLLFLMSANSFEQQYVSILAAKFPELDLQVIEYLPRPYPASDEIQQKLKEELDKEKPDIIVSIYPFEELAKSGALAELDPMIKADRFDLENVHSGVVETLRKQGGGRLYGLSPSMSASALFYNKDLFDKYQLPYPTDGMNWEEVLKLAQRFPKDSKEDERVYGYYTSSPDPYSLISYISSQVGLSFVNADGDKVAVTTDAWKSLWSLVLDSYRSGTVYSPSPDFRPVPGTTLKESQSRDKFGIGQAAMTVQSSYYVNNMASFRQSGFPSFEWGVVEEPTDPRRPGVSNMFRVGETFSISAKSPNLKLAWEVVRYINSEPFGKVFAKTSTFNLPARPALAKTVDGHSLDAFYKLKPGSSDQADLLGKLPVSFRTKFQQLASAKAKAVLEGSETTNEALRSLEAEGQKALDEAKRQGGEAK